MSELVGNSVDWFSHDAAHFGDFQGPQKMAILAKHTFSCLWLTMLSI